MPPKKSVNYLWEANNYVYIYLTSLSSESVMHFCFCFLCLHKEFLSETCEKCNDYSDKIHVSGWPVIREAVY